MKSADLIEWFKKKHSYIIDIYLFISTGIYIAWQTYKTYQAGNLNNIEILFAAHNAVLIFVFLFRKKEYSLNKNIFAQIVALTAFFSGLFFMGSEKNGGQSLQMISEIIIAISMILGIFTIFNLGKSFGIFIALREVKTNGLYSLIRHPMYMTDILFRIGYLSGHFNIKILLLSLVSTAAYIYRAMLEEKFLSQTTEYKLYMSKVKYRFIPYVF